ncbi:Early nodulin-like protein 1 [Melia azedarach]|uniref:Early nodulin-like protein 1 n=1 Tax=Melia azedarach TaxID=155640 RepID=A0ACC1XSF2_MELAZ|nr:Early nodulin-like protein 1 [Melia azedarach]
MGGAWGSWNAIVNAVIGLALVLLNCVSAMDHVVSGSSGCHLIPSTINAYVGDTLEFTDTLDLIVQGVNQQEYATCTTVNSITVHNSSRTVVHLNQPGMLYFICGGHAGCTMGLKFSLNVLPQHAANVTRRGGGIGGSGGSLPKSPRRPPKSPSKRRSPPPPSTPDHELPDINIPETAASPTTSVSSAVGVTITARSYDFWWAILFATVLVYYSLLMF